MHRSGDRTFFSATDVSGHLACPHLTSLEYRHVLGGPDHPHFPDPAKDVLRKRGHEHEDAILAGYRSEGLRVERGPDRDWSAGPDGWAPCARETERLMREGVDVIHQATFVDGSWLGIPDFLVRVAAPSALGDWSYEVVDAKLARSAKAPAVLQVCFYSELLEGVQGRAPSRMHLALGGPDAPFETFRVADYAAYYRSVKRRFQAMLAEDLQGRGEGGIGPDTPTPDLPTYPEPCTHCQVCDWSPECDRQWHADDHLSLVAGITRKQRARLEERAVGTMAALGSLGLPLRPRMDGVSDHALARVREQARIQVEGRDAGRVLHELLPEAEPGHGLEALPEPSPGDLFFDIEGDPHAFEEGIEYLLGWVDEDGTFQSLWALDPDAEKEAFETFVDMLTKRLERWPDLHVYHYNHYETSAMKRLAGRHGTREVAVDRLLRGQVFVDLYRVVRQGLRASVESYSIKKLEPLYDFHRDPGELHAANKALAAFEAWLELGGDRGDEKDEEFLASIERYNRDDCLSTLALRDWLEERRGELVELRGEEVPRPEAADPDPSEALQEETEEVRALVDALAGGVPAERGERSDEEHARWLLAQLLSYHRREDKSYWWEHFTLLDLDPDECISDRKALGGLEYEGEVDQVKRSVVHRYRFPPQDHRIKVGKGVKDPDAAEDDPTCGEVWALDNDAGTLDLKRGRTSTAPHPTRLIPHDFVGKHEQKKALLRLAHDVAADGLDGAANRAAADLLLARPPRVGQEPGTPLRAEGEDIVDAGRRLARALDRTVLPVQGPPGSGKTYLGARMIRALLRDGRRVGITATSHKVICNLLREVCTAEGDEPTPVRAVQKGKADEVLDHPDVTRATGNPVVVKALEDGEANVVAGTTWLWAREDVAEAGGVDVLFIDEASQISLADVLAASAAADSIVLLGDPQQLEQPQKGVHPPGAEVAALQHLLGGAATMPPDRGLFLEKSWRLHPELCAFTSELFYAGRLTAQDGRERQRVDGTGTLDGTGLRFVGVAHEGNTSESAEEVRAVAELVDRVLASDARWVDADGEPHDLGVSDILVVAPYNAQVSALRAALPDGARVGTVDKFQGQEAPVVIYSTATSTAEDAPRGMEFVYSPNRLNVATSRARCLAVAVGSPALYAPDCRSVRQMLLANGFCRFGEMAGVEPGDATAGG